MPGRFYSDLLSGSDSRLGIDWGKDHTVADKNPEGWLHPSSGDAFKDVSYTFKAQPKKTVAMEVSKTSEGEWKGTQRAVAEKTAAKVKVNHGDGWNSAWSMCNDKFTCDVSGNPDVSGDYPMNVTVKTECKPAKKEWKAKFLWDVSTPDMSGAKFYQNFELEHNQKKEWLVKSKTNVHYEDQYSVGAHVEHDTKDFTKQRVQIVCSPKDSDSTYWIRADTKREFVGSGCDQKLKEGIRHSWEGLYSWTDGFKGVGGQPIKLLGGVHYDLSDQSCLSASGEVGENYMVKSGATHKVDKNWTFGVNQRFDSSKLAVSGTNPYDIGFSMTYKL